VVPDLEEEEGEFKWHGLWIRIWRALSTKFIDLFDEWNRRSRRSLKVIS
jgi:hypothetical protein